MQLRRTTLAATSAEFSAASCSACFQAGRLLSAIRPKQLIQLVAALALSFAFASSSEAGILDGHGDAFNGVTGSVPFDNGVGLNGTIDFAVFTASDFNANFAGLGYVPGDSLVYAYQVFATGSLGVSAELVGIPNPANTIGTFDIGDVDASASFTPDASWLFLSEISTGQSSWGLAFSSPNLPIVGFSTSFGGETQALVAGVPVPGNLEFSEPTPVPEPASLLLVTSGLIAASCLSRRSRRIRP